MKKRILISGGSGLLALNSALQLRTSHEVVLALHTRELALAGVQARRIDLETPESVRETLAEVRPDYVIHTAAATNVELCEANPAMARHVNVELPRRLAHACMQHGCGFVHVSTDHLFNGQTTMASEDTPVSPLNSYGTSKAEAETAVFDAYATSLVIRTNFYGWGPPWRQSFSDIILGQLRAGQAANIFADVYYTPILAESLITAMVALAEGGHAGCFNVVGDERLSKYEFAVALARIFGLDAALVRPTRIADIPNLVARPRDMSLSNARLQETLGRPMGNTQEHLQRLLEQEQAGMRKELYGLRDLSR